MRKKPLVIDNYYHVLNRSIAKFIIFNDEHDYHRFLEIIDLYRYKEFNYKYSAFLDLSSEAQKTAIDRINKGDCLVQIVAYCIMPTHFHLFLKQLEDKGISRFIARVLNSYTRYFNKKYGRKGPLWEGRFKSILVETDSQCLYLTRYIHLNPASAGLTEQPEDWHYSSYLEFLSKKEDGFCQFNELIDTTPKQYKKFVNDRIDFQKQLSIIKYLLLEEYAG